VLAAMMFACIVLGDVKSVTTSSPAAYVMGAKNEEDNTHTYELTLRFLDGKHKKPREEIVIVEAKTPTEARSIAIKTCHPAAVLKVKRVD
jgi:hypothetical protein